MKFLHTHQLQVAKTSSVITPLPSSRHPGQWLITLVSIHFGGLRLTVTTSEVAFLTKVRTYCGDRNQFFSHLWPQVLRVRLASNHCLVVGLPLWKMMELKSVGMMKFPTEWKVIIHSCSKAPISLATMTLTGSDDQKPISDVQCKIYANLCL